MKIEKPDWAMMLPIGLQGLSTGHREYSECCEKRVRKMFPFVLEHLTNWYEDQVEPINKMLEGAVEVTAWQTLDAEKDWIAEENKTGLPDHFKCHKALLINIEPIVKESAEDILRELYEHNGIVHNSDMGRRTAKVLGEE